MTAATPGKGYRHFVAWFLAIVYTFNFMDRQIVTILQESIKKDLHFTDTELGLLTGLTFALFYTICGFPVAWLCDRKRRVTIMAAAVAVWSAFTIACGFAQNFVQMAVARVLVGAGEAGGSPPSYSLISDYFPPRQRGTALAIYSLGVPVGSALGAFAGSLIAARYGWRMAFIAVGAPGILLAMLMLLLIREPVRGGTEEVVVAPQPPAPFFASIRDYFASRTLLLTALSSGMSAFVGYAMLNWNASMLMRVKGMTQVEVGVWYSLLLGVTGIIGTFAAGWLVDTLGQRDRRWYAWVPALAFVGSIPGVIGIIFAPSWPIALACMAIPQLFNNMYLAPAIAVVQNAAPPHRRTMAGATMLFVLNLIGLGGGPVFMGRISDWAKPAWGDHSLLVAYAALVPMFLVTIGTHLLVARSIGRDHGK